MLNDLIHYDKTCQSRLSPIVYRFDPKELKVSWRQFALIGSLPEVFREDMKICDNVLREGLLHEEHKNQLEKLKICISCVFVEGLKGKSISRCLLFHVNLKITAFSKSQSSVLGISFRSILYFPLIYRREEDQSRAPVLSTMTSSHTRMHTCIRSPRESYPFEWSKWLFLLLFYSASTRWELSY